MNALLRLRIVSAIAIALAGSLPAAALAAWSTSGGGSAAGSAPTMPAGNAPTTSATGADITVSWTAASFPGGTNVAGYIVQRYNAANGGAATVGPGCTGTVTTTSCTEQSVPAGSWVYTDTPVQLTWSGTESAPSAAVTVTAAPAQGPTTQTAGVTGGKLLSVPSVSFQSQPINAVSRARPITLTDNLSRPLVVSHVSIVGAGARDFTSAVDSCSHRTLKPGQSCTVLVVFRPSAPGLYAASLTFADNAPHALRAIALRGIGTIMLSRSTHAGRRGCPERGDHRRRARRCERRT